MLSVRNYLITITMPDGSRGRHSGLYSDGFAAIILALDMFPEARCIAARRLA